MPSLFDDDDELSYQIFKVPEIKKAKFDSRQQYEEVPWEKHFNLTKNGCLEFPKVSKKYKRDVTLCGDILITFYQNTKYLFRITFNTSFIGPKNYIYCGRN